MNRKLTEAPESININISAQGIQDLVTRSIQQVAAADKYIKDFKARAEELKNVKIVGMGDDFLNGKRTIDNIRAVEKLKPLADSISGSNDLSRQINDIIGLGDKCLNILNSIHLNKLSNLATLENIFKNRENVKPVIDKLLSYNKNGEGDKGVTGSGKTLYNYIFNNLLNTNTNNTDTAEPTQNTTSLQSILQLIESRILNKSNKNSLVSVLSDLFAGKFTTYNEINDRIEALKSYLALLNNRLDTFDASEIAEKILNSDEFKAVADDINIKVDNEGNVVKNKDNITSTGNNIEAEYKNIRQNGTSEDVYKFWTNYFKTIWKNNPIILKIKKELQVEIAAKGFRTSNPFIAYWSTGRGAWLSSLSSISEADYIIVHNKIAKGDRTISENDLRGTGRLGLNNILFCADLYKQSPTDFNTFINAQADILRNIKDNDEALRIINTEFYSAKPDKENAFKATLVDVASLEKFFDREPELGSGSKKETNINNADFIKLLNELSENETTAKVAAAKIIMSEISDVSQIIKLLNDYKLNNIDTKSLSNSTDRQLNSYLQTYSLNEKTVIDAVKKLLKVDNK